MRGSIRSKLHLVAGAGVGALLAAATFSPSCRAAAAGGPARPEFRVIRDDATGVVVEVTPPAPNVVPADDRRTIWSVDGWTTTQETGAPELPITGFNLAIPPGTRPVLSVRGVVSVPAPGDPPRPAPARLIFEGADGLPVQQEERVVDERRYAEPFPAAWASLGPVQSIRFLPIVPVTVSPYRWDPSLRAVQAASRLEVEVRFEADPAADARGPGLRRAPDRTLGPDKPGWDRLYSRTVLNAHSARSWRRAPALPTRTSAKTFLPDGPVFRVPVTKSDLHRVPYTSLVAAGWDLGSVPVSRLALSERFFVERYLDVPDSIDLAFRDSPVPIQVRDLDGDGLFGPGDDFVFFGLNAWDRLHPAPRDKRYGREHDYFLTVRDEGGVRFTEAPSFADTVLVPVTTSVVTRRYEDDGVYMPSYAAGDTPGSISLGVDAIREEHMYWVGGPESDYPAPFDLPGILPGAGNLLRVSAPVQRTFMTSDPDVRVTFAVRAPGGAYTDLPGALRLTGKARGVFTQGPDSLAAIALGPSGNLLRMRLVGGLAALDWMEWTWRRDLVAVDKKLFFHTNDLAGLQEFRLLGFGPADSVASSRLLLLDLADSSRTATTAGPRLLTWRASQFDGIVLRVQLDLGDPPRPRTIYAVSPAAAIQPSGIERVSEDDLTEPDGADEDLVVVAHPDFREGIAPLVQARRDQGLSVRVSTPRQIYDRFNGGRPSPVAIRSYLRYLFRARANPPSFLLLVGDASEDFTGAFDQSAPNYVPTQTVFGDASDFTQGRELVASDEWFVDNLSRTLGEQVYFSPEMHVGRIPAGSTTELAAAVDKILAYGDYQDTDTWRSRALLISDDEFSSTLAGTEAYRYQGDTSHLPRRAGESIFRWSAWETRRLIQETAGFAEFGVDTFFTATYMDTVPGLQRCRELGESEPDCTVYPCPFGEGGPRHCFNTISAPYGDSPDPRSDNYNYGRTVVPPILRQYLNRGHLLAIYQGHAHARVMSHEYIYYDATGLREDTRLLQNDGRPFFFMGFGCHLAQFAGYKEGLSSVGDCVTERMLFADRGRGAVAAYASTNYEWLGNTATPNLAVIRSMFVDPPRDPVTDRTRWLLGEIITDAKWRMASPEYASPAMVATYTLLGDPSMPLEMAPPRFSVYVNCEPDAGPSCEPWMEGVPLAAEAGSDTVRIRVRLQDEQSLSGRIRLRDGSGDIDSSAYRLASDPRYPGDDRRLELAYDRALAPPASDYDIEIEVTDAAGRTRRASLPVEFGTAFFVVRNGASMPLGEQDILETGDSVLVSFVSPVDLDATATDLWLDSARLPTYGPALAPGARSGELRAVLPELTGGEHRLRIRTAAPGGSAVERAQVFQGPGGGESRLLLLYNFPNPFDQGTAFCYRLSRAAASAKVSVFTLSGRKIWSAEGSARANDNSITWDGRDADGDPVANGLYLYKLEVRTAEGRTISRVERAARVR